MDELARGKIKESTCSRKSELKLNLSNKKLTKISSLDRTEEEKIDSIGV